jgi:hypothetical protein
VASRTSELPAAEAQLIRVHKQAQKKGTGGTFKRIQWQSYRLLKRWLRFDPRSDAWDSTKYAVIRIGETTGWPTYSR